MDSLFEELNTVERDVFKRIVNHLMGKTFIVNHIYDCNKKRAVMNPDYRFIESHLELFKTYLDLGGWKLERNDNYEVIYITSVYAYNRVKLDKFTTIILYILRLMYDQKRENINLTEHIVVSVSEIVSTLNEIGAYEKRKPSAQELRNALKSIAKFNIIQKIEGQYENPNTKIIILPSILFAITAETITKINDNINEIKEAEDSNKLDEDEDEEDLLGEEVEGNRL